MGKLPRHIGVLLPFIICCGRDFSKCLVIRATGAGRGQKCRRYFGCKAPVGSRAEQSPAVAPILRLLSETEFRSVLISSHPLPFKMYPRVNLRSVRHQCRLMLLLMIIHRLASSCARLLCFFFPRALLLPVEPDEIWKEQQSFLSPPLPPHPCKTNHFVCDRVVWLPAGSGGRRFFRQGCYFMMALFNPENYKYIIASRLQTESGPYLRYIQAILAAWFKA